jgi:ribosomal protein L18
MFKKEYRQEARVRRHLRVRKKISGTAEDQDLRSTEVKRIYMLN